MKLCHHRRAGRMRGRTLIELMISITLGIIVTGAMIAIYLSTGISSRQATAVSRMNEDAAIVLGLIDSQVRMAGFSIPRKGVPSGSALADGVSSSLPDRNFTGAGIRACDHGFVNSTAAFRDLACASGPTGGAAFSVRFEGADPAGADAYRNLLPPNLDCLGAGIDTAKSVIGALGDSYPLVEVRYRVAPNASSGTSDLSCAGNGSSFIGQPMAQNVEDMRLSFGIATDGQSSTVVQYLKTAAEVDALGGSVDQNWSRVVTVRLCLLIRSASRSPGDAGTTYLDCDGDPITASDGFLRRAYVNTVTLRNRGGIAVTAP